MTTPQPPADPAYGPPQGGQPAYGPPPTDQPPMGQAPMGQAPMGQPGQPPFPPPEPVKSGGGKRKLITFAIIAVVAIIAIGVSAWNGRSKPAAAKVGDCLSGTTEDNLKKIGCDDAKVNFKIVGKVDKVPYSDIQANKPDLCNAFPTAESYYWEGEKGKTGYVLCLEPVKK